MSDNNEVIKKKEQRVVTLDISLKCDKLSKIQPKGTSARHKLILLEEVIPDTIKVWVAVKLDPGGEWKG